MIYSPSVGTGSRTGTQGCGASDTNRWKYGLTERDDATGLDHTWWRKYENLSGRWTTPDPYRGSMEIANPQSFNRYAYLQNDPVNLIDPSGLEIRECGYNEFGDPIYCTYTNDFANPLFVIRSRFGGYNSDRPLSGGGTSTGSQQNPEDPKKFTDKRAAVVAYSADDGRNWSIVYRHAKVKSLNASFALDANHIWAVGDGGLIVRLAYP